MTLNDRLLSLKWHETIDSGTEMMGINTWRMKGRETNLCFASLKLILEIGAPRVKDAKIMQRSAKTLMY